MYKTARNALVLGAGLGISGLVGWLLLRENKRIRDARQMIVRSQLLSSPADEMQEIVLPREALDAAFEPITTLSDPTDDFTQIKGIGARYADALAASGITRYHQLAAHTPDTLAALLLPQVPTLSARQIQNKDWIGQAARLSGKQQQK
jgi:predicted flap endonuclease-1-like 5' DNA nuclease